MNTMNGNFLQFLRAALQYSFLCLAKHDFIKIFEHSGHLTFFATLRLAELDLLDFTEISSFSNVILFCLFASFLALFFWEFLIGVKTSSDLELFPSMLKKLFPWHNCEAVTNTTPLLSHRKRFLSGCIH